MAFHEEGAQVAVVDLTTPLPAPTTLDELGRMLDEGLPAVDVAGLTDALTDVSGLRRVLAGRTFTAIVPDEEVRAPLTGLSGTAVARARATSEDLTVGLAADARAREWLRMHDLDDAPGAGACDGLGAVLLDAGLRLETALGWAVQRTRLRETAVRADLVVTACSDLDFQARGGPLVQTVVEVAGEALRPVIVVAGRNFVSRRELRLAGIEDAHAVHAGAVEEPVREPELVAVASRVARTWRFPSR